MARQRKKSAGRKRTKGQPSIWQRLLEWRPNLQFRLGPRQREIAGFFLLILAAATILGLSNISSGAILDWWETVLRRLFGWWALPLAVAVALMGLWLLWRELRERMPVGPSRVIGLELLFLILLTASHAPLVIRMGANGAWTMADQGRGGGIVGWALSVLLLEGLGPLVGSFVLMALLLVVLFALLGLTWAEVRDWLSIHAAT